MGLFGKKNTQELVFSIEGMHCNMCAANLQRGLLETPGVTKAQVSFDEGTAHIVYDPAKTDRNALAAAVKEIGYGVKE